MKLEYNVLIAKKFTSSDWYGSDVQFKFETLEEAQTFAEAFAKSIVSSDTYRVRITMDSASIYTAPPAVRTEGTEQEEDNDD